MSRNREAVQNKPDWLTKGALCHHKPTGIAFRAERLRPDTDSYSKLCIESCGILYSLDECGPVDFEWFQQRRRWFQIDGKVVAVNPHSKGFLVSGNGRRLIVQVDDEVMRSAKSLAKFFDGVVADCDGSNYFTQEEDISDDDW